MPFKTASSSAILAILATGTAVAVTAGIYFYQKQQARTDAEQEEGPSTRVFPDKATVSKALCAFVADSAAKAISDRGTFHLAVAGGSLLDALSKLADHKDKVDFSKVVLTFANHKCVAPTDAKATLTKAKAKFANAAGITTFVATTATPTKDSNGSSEAAIYAKALMDAVPHNHEGFPVLDLVLLGLGADGHIGSCHPMGPAVAETSKTVVGSPKTGEPSSITLTVESMNSARQVGVVVCGGSKGKKEAVKRAQIRPAEQPRGTFPAQLLRSPVFVHRSRPQLIYRTFRLVSVIVQYCLDRCTVCRD